MSCCAEVKDETGSSQHFVGDMSNARLPRRGYCKRLIGYYLDISSGMSGESHVISLCASILPAASCRHSWPGAEVIIQRLSIAIRFQEISSPATVMNADKQLFLEVDLWG